MPRVLKEIDIKMISLVRAGANRKEIIYKNESLYDTLRVDFSKSDEELGVVYGIVYAPNEIDTQGDTAEAFEIRKAAYKFMKNSNLIQCVDVEHSLEPVPAYICESWIVKEGDPFFSEVGAWAVGIKLESEDLRDAVKRGEINGLSMYGSGVVEKTKKTLGSKGGTEVPLPEFGADASASAGIKKSLSETIKEVLKNIFEKEFNQKEEETMNEEQIKELVKSSVESAMADIKKEYEEKLEAQSRQIAELEAQISKSKQLKEVNEVSKSTTGGIL